MALVCDVAEAARKLAGHDATMTTVDLEHQLLTDADVGALVDCLLDRPDAVRRLVLDFNQLTDETGAKLARYLAASATVEWLGLSSNRITDATYTAVAAALRVNTSLRDLWLYDNRALDGRRIDAAFVDALRLNPHRPANSIWWLYPSEDEVMPDYQRLRCVADQLGHPTMQQLLLTKVY